MFWHSDSKKALYTFYTLDPSELGKYQSCSIISLCRMDESENCVTKLMFVRSENDGLRQRPYGNLIHAVLQKALTRLLGTIHQLIIMWAVERLKPKLTLETMEKRNREFPPKPHEAIVIAHSQQAE